MRSASWGSPLWIEGGDSATSAADDRRVAQRAVGYGKLAGVHRLVAGGEQEQVDAKDFLLP